MAIDVADLAHEMGLTIERHHITKDFSVFGQIFLPTVMQNYTISKPTLQYISL
jgi:hypothetical protein